MKILIVNYRYFVSGGPEKYLFNIKELLEQNGHTVYPFSVHSNKNVKTEYDKYFVNPIGGRDAVYYEDCKKTPKTIWQMLTRSIYSVEVKKALKKMIADVSPDIVYIIHFVNKLSPSVIDAAKEMGVPVVLRLSDYFMLCPRFDFLHNKKICEDCIDKGYRSCIKKRCVKNSLSASFVRVFSMKVHNWIKIYDKIDAFVTPSLYLKEKLKLIGIKSERIHHIPTFYMGDPESNATIGEYGLYFGRISEEKGVDILVDAYEKIDKSFKLKIVGDDTTQLAIKLKQYVKDKNIDNIEFLGFKQGAELRKYINEAKFVIIPSIWYDNMPNVALESFALGKPVIASNIGSLPELVQHDINGYLFEPGSIEELIECIMKMQDNQNVLKMGHNAQKIAQEKFSAQLHYNRLIELFESLQECINLPKR